MKRTGVVVLAFLAALLGFAGSLFAQPTAEQQVPGGTSPAAVVAPPPIEPLPKRLTGRWELLGTNARIYQNKISVEIISVDAEGNLTGKLSSWSSGTVVNDPCATVVDLPMKGTYDGTTLRLEAKSGECGRRYVLKKGNPEHLFYAEDPKVNRKWYLDKD